MTGDSDRHRTERVIARLNVLWNFTQLEEAPYEAMLRDLFDGDATHVKWVLAPTGRSFGVGAVGHTDEFSQAAADWTEEMLDGPAADVFAGMVLDSPAGTGLELETTLGEPTWFRAGLGVPDFDRLRETLAAVDADEATVERALRYEDVRGAAPRAVHLVQAPPDSWGLSVTVDLDSDCPDKPDDPAVGEGPVAVEEVVTDGGRTWYRRPGLADEDLIDWQEARGFGNREAGQVGEVHGAIDRNSPTDIVWEPGDLRETAVYVYKELIE